MPQLEVLYPDGRREQLPLSRTVPLTIGSQNFNDICISDAHVAALHCRIGWNKTGYEVTAATPKGVDVNATVVEHAFLRPGDVLHIGRCDLTYLGDSGEVPPKRKESAPPAKPREAAKASPVATQDLPLYTGPVEAESVAAFPAAEAAVSEELQELPDRQAAKVVKPADTGMAKQIHRELQGDRRRPGEQEIFKSPLILALGGGSVVLLLIAGTLWLLLGRETSARLYQQGEQDLAQARYAQAIEQFEEYIRRYPGSSRVLPARINAAKARVQKELTGTTPAWPLAWERLDQLVREFRNTESYAELRPTVRLYAEEVAIGAAVTAEQTRDASLLPVSAEAKLLLERTADPEAPITTVLERIATATVKAEAAIAKQQQRDATASAMQSALSAKQPIEALTEREALIRKFPDLSRDSGIASLLQQALQMEVGTIVVNDMSSPATLPPEPAPPLQILPVFQSRSRTSDASLGQVVWGLAQDSCYAIDTMTGEVRWRRVIGASPPFAPVASRGQHPGWLMFDRRSGSLVHCRTDTGELLWRRELPAEPAGGPLIDEGQIYLATKNQELQRIDLETGTLTATVAFSQPVLGPPALNSSGEMLFLPGHRGLFYALRKRPLEAVAVTFTDHAPGSVRVPMVTIGRLLLLAENDRTASGRLRLWNGTNPQQPLPMELEQRTSGLIFDTPLLRGSQLVVPLQGERVSAYVVNDAMGHSELTSVGLYRVQDGYNGPLNVVIGPDQQFWMSSTAFRRFEIAADSIRMDPNSVALGLTAQPLQFVGETFFTARRSRFGEAVQVMNIDRNTMTGTWRTVVGARPLAATVGPNGNVVLVSESGFVSNIGPERLRKGGLEPAATVDLDLPVDLTTPPLISPLGDGRIVLAIAGATPRMWIIEPTGRVIPPVNLAGPLEQPPLMMDAGLILPLAGRLKVLSNSGGPAIEDWRAPVDTEAPPAWAHFLRTAADEFLTFDSDGRCRRMEIRQGELPHLTEIASHALTAPLVQPPIIVGDLVIVATTDRQLQGLNLRTLEPQYTAQLERPLVSLSPVNTHILAWDSDQVRCLDPTNQFSTVWSVAKVGSEPVGAPLLRGDKLWVSCQQGEVLVLDRTQGTILSQFQLPQILASGPLEVGNAVWTAACDGTLYQLDRLAEPQP